MLVERLKTAML